MTKHQIQSIKTSFNIPSSIASQVNLWNPWWLMIQIIMSKESIWDMILKILRNKSQYLHHRDYFIIKQWRRKSTHWCCLNTRVTKPLPRVILQNIGFKEQVNFSLSKIRSVCLMNSLIKNGWPDKNTLALKNNNIQSTNTHFATNQYFISRQTCHHRIDEIELLRFWF